MTSDCNCDNIPVGAGQNFRNPRIQKFKPDTMARGLGLFLLVLNRRAKEYTQRKGTVETERERLLNSHLLT
jgi:hypothetical protein